MTQNKKIAVTGGIGSGKSLALEYLSQMGYAVFSCDEISHALWKTPEYTEALAALFPECTKKGRIDKAALTELVFSHEAAKKKLERFSHPRIMEELLRRAGRERIAFCEVPLLFEGGFEGLFDGVIAVVRDEKKRIDAVVLRDKTTREEAKRRISSQLPVALLDKKKCVILQNNGTKEEFFKQLSSALTNFGLE